MAKQTEIEMPPLPNRWKRWTPAELDILEAAIEANQNNGIYRSSYRDNGRMVAHIKRAAVQLGRPYAAVLKKAQRMGMASYRRRGVLPPHAK